MLHTVKANDRLIKIDVFKDEETGVWVSYSSDLDLYSQGNTEEEAAEALEMGINTHLKICKERGIEIEGF